jgi:hypothetical protein
MDSVTDGQERAVATTLWMRPSPSYSMPRDSGAAGGVGGGSV